MLSMKVHVISVGIFDDYFSRYRQNAFWYKKQYLCCYAFQSFQISSIPQKLQLFPAQELLVFAPPVSETGTDDWCIVGTQKGCAEFSPDPIYTYMTRDCSGEPSKKNFVDKSEF